MKKSTRSIVTLILIVSLCFAVAGCNRQNNDPTTVTPTTTAIDPTTVAPTTAPDPTTVTPTTAPDPTTPDPNKPEERTVTVTDMSGDEVTIKGEVTRIINLWPAGTSSFFAMGAGDLLAGMANTGSINEWVKFLYPDSVNIPTVGGTTPTVEDLIKLNPDLVIIHPSTAASGFAQQIRAVGIPAININFSNYETMRQAYTILGEVLGGEYQQKLTDWCDETDNKITNVRNLTANLTAEQRPVVYYIAGQSNSMTSTMAADSIFSDWVESAGGRYGTRLMSIATGDITAESIFALNPDVFIVGGVWQHVIKNSIETTAGWQDLKAVKNERLYTNPYACFNWDRFGLESQLQINYALLCIQPEIAAANGINRESMIGEIIAFYQKYTNVELTQQQAEYMLDGLSPDGKAENSVQ